MNSEELFSRAVKVIPGGVNSPVRAFGAVGGKPFFVTRAKGDRLFDADGREYIDYVCSWGPCILGHAYPEIVEAVEKTCRDGLTFGAPTEREVELAELISQAVPAAEMVRLVNSGTEATMSAIRAARGFTGRDKIVKFRGNYHGHSDGLLVKAGSGCLTGGVPDSAGVPASFTKETLVAEYNDLASVEALFENNRGQIACVIVEPVAANMSVVPPAEGFLQGLRDLTAREGALLLFDEVITGFRIAYGGASEYFAVTPDLFAFGKIVGGGMPLACYGGRRDILSCVAPAGKVYQAGTLSGNPVAVAAGLAALKALARQKGMLYRELDEKGARLQRAYEECGIAVNRVGSLLTPFFGVSSVRSYADVARCDKARFARYFSAMLEEGVYVAPSQFEAMFVSAAHTQEDISRTCEAISRAAGRE